ncbi:MAG: hypothetical protein QW480_02465, partial [Candidatus Aenigmatarchaeota archaeon]
KDVPKDLSQLGDFSEIIHNFTKDISNFNIDVADMSEENRAKLLVAIKTTLGLIIDEILKFKSKNLTNKDKNYIVTMINTVNKKIAPFMYDDEVKNKMQRVVSLVNSIVNKNKKSSLYLKKDLYIEGSLKFFYVKGEGFRSSKIICKQGNKAVRTSLYNVLPTDVMLDIVENENTKFSPEDLVSVLNKKFSSIEEFSQWVKRSFKNRRK